MNITEPRSSLHYLTHTEPSATRDRESKKSKTSIDSQVYSELFSLVAYAKESRLSEDIERMPFQPYSGFKKRVSQFSPRSAQQEGGGGSADKDRRDKTEKERKDSVERRKRSSLRIWSSSRNRRKSGSSQDPVFAEDKQTQQTDIIPEVTTETEVKEIDETVKGSVQVGEQVERNGKVPILNEETSEQDDGEVIAVEACLTPDANTNVTVEVEDSLQQSTKPVLKLTPITVAVKKVIGKGKYGMVLKGTKYSGDLSSLHPVRRKIKKPKNKPNAQAQKVERLLRSGKMLFHSLGKSFAKKKKKEKQAQAAIDPALLSEVAVKVLRITSTPAAQFVAANSEEETDLSALIVDSACDVTFEGRKKFCDAFHTKLVENEKGYSEMRCLQTFSDCPFVINLLAHKEIELSSSRKIGSLAASSVFVAGSLRASCLKRGLYAELWLVMDLYDEVPATFLNVSARAKSTLALSEVKTVLASLLLALKALHSKSYVHRDIKPGNILIKRDPTTRKVLKAVLCDFGACTTWEKDDVPIWRGTFGYLAPEYLKLCQACLSFTDYRKRDPEKEFEKLMTKAVGSSRTTSQAYSTKLRKCSKVTFFIKRARKATLRLSSSRKANKGQGGAGAADSKAAQQEDIQTYLGLCSNSGAVDVWAVGFCLLSWVFGVNPLAFQKAEVVAPLLCSFAQQANDTPEASILQKQDPAHEELAENSEIKQEGAEVEKSEIPQQCSEQDTVLESNQTKGVLSVPPYRLQEKVALYSTFYYHSASKLKRIEEQDIDLSRFKDSPRITLKDGAKEYIGKDYFNALFKIRGSKYCEAMDFMSKCLTYHPDKRATIAELCEHDFIKDEVRLLKQVYSS